MRKIKILITMIPPTPEIKAALKEIENHAEIRFAGNGENIGGLLDDVEVLYGSIPENDFHRAERMRWIQTNSTGVDHMMYPAFQNSDIMLTNTGSSITTVVAEHAIAMLLALARNLHIQRDHMREHKWQIECGTEIGALALGIIGLGKIGTAIAERAGNLFREINAVDMRTADKPGYIRRLYSFTEMPEFLSRCNAVVCAVPLTPTTCLMIGRRELEMMPEKSYLVNISRGGIVDEEALIRALRSGRLAGAGLDVTEIEPYPADGPLWNEPKLLLTPHSAGYCGQLELRKIRQFVDNFKSYLETGKPLSCLDKTRGW